METGNKIGKPWMEVIITGAEDATMAAADYLVIQSGQGVISEDVAFEPGRFRVRGFFPSGPEQEAQMAVVSNYAAELSILSGAEVRAEFKPLEQQDWSRQWRRHFHPRAVTRHLVVAPPWEEPRARFGQEVVVIDPGQAFGTGQHESTVLCLEHLERLRRRWKLPEAVLDVGTGSGILALAALRFGLPRAVGIDIDPLAVEAAGHNAELNGLSGRFSVSETPLEKLSEKFDLVFANLTAGDLNALARPLAARLTRGGQLVASGILVRQALSVRQTFEALGLQILEQDSMGGWCALVLE